MRLNDVKAWIIVLTLIGISLFRRTADAASVGPNGYTNDFSVQPAAADWSSYSIPGANTLINNIADMDAQVQLLSASTVSSQTLADPGNPPAASSGVAAWSSSGLYLATRETGNAATILMCTLVNNSGSTPAAVTLSYTFTKAGGAGDSGEEIPGFRCYYSLSGAAGSWTSIPQFSSVSAGNLTATLPNLAWPVGGSLYILWADDNGQNVSPDDSQQIDNFSAIAVPPVPVAITGQPQNQTVAESAPASFSVVASGVPAPTFQWYTNSVAITDATNSIYSIASTPFSLNGAQFQVVAANTFTGVTYTATSSVAVLTVTADTTPPTVVRLDPPAGSTNAELSSIEVLFSEPVTGVDASDLLINGVPATSITLGVPGQFVFDFPQPPTGIVTVAWAPNHGITDLAAASNSFAGGSWTYTLDPNYTATLFVINEFLASNNKGLRDEDGDDSDWLELFNPNLVAGNLGGWFLTDDPLNLTKWQFPYRVMDPGSYLVVFCSGKDRTNLIPGTIFTNFHTSFNLKAGGSYLALVDPNTNVVSAFSPSYPPQTANISYGRDRSDLNLVGYFSTPTPRGPNSTTGAGIAGAISFSRDSGNFPSNAPFNLTLSTPASNAVIFYAFGTNVPGSNTFSYTAPISVTNTLAIRARAFEPGKLPGPVTTKFYIMLDTATNVVKFNSGLPIIILHNYGQGTVPVSKSQQFVFLEAFDNEYGYSSMTNVPTLTARGTFHVRGSSTAVASTSKSQFALQINDEFNEGLSVSLLGLPEESDWIFYAPNNFEPVMIHNPLSHQLYRDVGRYGSRTRYFELWLKDDSGTPGSITSAEYNGIYVLEEKIKRDQNRVDVARLDAEDETYPALTGGFVLSIDRIGPGASVLANFTNAAGGAWFPNGGATINYVSPNGLVFTNAMRAPQTNYIAQYINQFSRDLYGINYTNLLTTNHYSNYIDVDNWIDLHIHETLTMNVDGMRLSGYFFKDRNSKLGYGPTWDYDRTQGSTDTRDFNPRTWQSTLGDLGTDFFNPQVTAPSVPWWGRLFTAPDFWQAWIDRYQQLRQPGEALSTNNIFAHIDEFTSEVRAAQPRELARWGFAPRSGVLTFGGFTNNFGVGLGYQAEVNWEKTWYSNRLDFADHQFLAPPSFSAAPGSLAGTTTIVITPAAGLGDKPANTQLLLTLDGTDPRLPGGAISTGANVLSNTGPITVSVSNAVRLFARSRNPAHVQLTGAHNPPISSPWSGSAVGTFYVSNATPPLRITEIMYNPPKPPVGITTDADQFEYLEFKNISATPLDVTGFRLRSGVEFDFPSLVLAAGQTCLVVADVVAFSSRYNTNGLIVAGSYTNDPNHNHLGNDGDHLKLEGRFHEPILDFDYSDSWYPTTDGAGFSLQIVDENLPTSAWGLKSSWRPSGQLNGTPGTADPGAVTIATVYINEVLTHETPPLTDAIELYNPNGAAVDVSGWFLTDNFSSPKKYRIPSGTVIAANGYVVFYASNSFTFGISAGGDDVYLFSGDANTNLTGYVHGFTFGAQADGVTFGRYVTSDGQEHFPAQITPSLGSANVGPKVGPIVISEIHYHPPDVATVEGPRNDLHSEFVELENITGVDQPLFDPNFPTNTWLLRNGIDYTFPTNVTIPAGGHVVVASFDPADPITASRFMASNHLAVGTPLFGPFQGQLDNAGDSIELARPDVPPLTGNVNYILVDKVSYSDGPPWPSAADGLGFSIQRLDPAAYGDDPANWIAAPYSAGASRVAGLPPIIATQPTSQVVALGGTASFNVSATGSGPFTYAWLFGGNFISGATSSNLTLNNLQTSQGGAYQVLVQNSAGVAASSAANLTVVLPVAIVQQPQSQTVRLTDLTNPITANVSFSVIANGYSPVNYQWLVNGTNIPGATSLALTLNNVSPSQTGDYTVIATDPYSSATSSVARLNVFTDNGWRFASLTGDFNNGTNVDIYMQAAGDFYIDDISLVPATGPYAGINVVTNGDFESPLTVGPWLIPASMSNSARTNSISHAGSFSLHVVAASAGNIILGTVIKHPLPPVGSNVCTLSFWYHAQDSTNFFVRTFPGSSINNVNGFSPKPVDSSPGIASQPNSLTLPAAATANFAVSGYGSEPLAYQWFKDGVPLTDGGSITGAATTLLTVSPVQALDMGNYTVKVSNALGSSNSVAASLIVTGAPPQITQQPQSQQVACHGSVTFTVVANGSSPLSYQWRSNQVDILNETNTSLTLTNVLPANNGAYSVFVSNPAGSTNSTDANLVVTDSPASLVALRSGTNLLVSWPVTCAVYQLEETATLSPASWAPPANATLQQTPTVWTATIPILQSNKFYRLRN